MARAAYDATTEFLFPEDNRPKHEQIADYVNWYVDHSGLEQVPAVMVTSAAVTGTAILGSAAYSLSPLILVPAGTPTGQKAIEFGIEFISGASPYTGPLLNGLHFGDTGSVNQ